MNNTMQNFMQQENEKIESKTRTLPEKTIEMMSYTPKKRKNMSDKRRKYLQMRIGGEIRNRRQEAGITIKQLADLTNFSQAHISNIELGKRNISIGTLYSIIEALEAEINIIF